MKPLMIPLMVAAMAALAPPPASAASTAPGTVTLQIANDLAAATIAACQAIGQSAVVAVVDRGGNLVALQRGDDVGPHNTLAAQRKAFTALSTKSRTSVLAERAASDPSSRNLNTIPELLLLGGGVPLLQGGSVIGGIGVAGAGGSANDEQCAAQAIEKVLPGGR